MLVTQYDALSHRWRKERSGKPFFGAKNRQRSKILAMESPTWRSQNAASRSKVACEQEIKNKVEDGAVVGSNCKVCPLVPALGRPCPAVASLVTQIAIQVTNPGPGGKTDLPWLSDSRHPSRFPDQISDRGQVFMSNNIR
jgi:hypothetical protein